MISTRAQHSSDDDDDGDSGDDEHGTLGPGTPEGKRGRVIENVIVPFTA